MNFITVVIPCYNEFNSLPILIENLEKINNINFLIIDNGSTDESREYLNGKKLNKNINTLFIDENLGYGNGIYTGLKYIKDSRFVGWIHGDLQFEFSKLDEVFYDLKQFSNNDKIFYKGIRKGRSNLEKFFSFMMGNIATLVLKDRFYEINAQPTIFSSELVDYLQNPPADFSFDTYVYWTALNQKYILKRKVFEFPKRQFGKSNWNLGFFSRIKFSLKLILYFIYLRNL